MSTVQLKVIGTSGFLAGQCSIFQTIKPLIMKSNGKKICF